MSNMRTTAHVPATRIVEHPEFMRGYMDVRAGRKYCAPAIIQGAPIRTNNLELYYERGRLLAAAGFRGQLVRNGHATQSACRALRKHTQAGDII